MVRVHDTSGLQPFRLPSLTVLEAQASSAMAAEETDPIATPPTSPDRDADPEECAICLLPLQDPTAFPAQGCGHTYCATCLVKLQAHTPTARMACPQCRRRAPLPEAPAPPPPVPVSKARQTLLLLCVAVGVLLCILLLIYDMGVFGVPFYSSDSGFECKPDEPCVGNETEEAEQDESIGRWTGGRRRRLHGVVIDDAPAGVVASTVHSTMAGQTSAEDFLLECYGEPLAATNGTLADATAALTLPMVGTGTPQQQQQSVLVDRVVVQESLDLGQRIRNFMVLSQTTVGGPWLEWGRCVHFSCMHATKV